MANYVFSFWSVNLTQTMFMTAPEQYPISKCSPEHISWIRTGNFPFLSVARYPTVRLLPSWIVSHPCWLLRRLDSVDWYYVHYYIQEGKILLYSGFIHQFLSSSAIVSFRVTTQPLSSLSLRLSCQAPLFWNLPNPLLNIKPPSIKNVFVTILFLFKPYFLTTLSSHSAWK